MGCAWICRSRSCQNFKFLDDRESNILLAYYLELKFLFLRMVIQEQWDKPAPVRKHGGVRRYCTSTGPKTTERRKISADVGQYFNTDLLARDSSSGINYYYSFHISTCLYESFQSSKNLRRERTSSIEYWVIDFCVWPIALPHEFVLLWLNSPVCKLKFEGIRDSVLRRKGPNPDRISDFLTNTY